MFVRRGIGPDGTFGVRDVFLQYSDITCEAGFAEDVMETAISRVVKVRYGKSTEMMVLSRYAVPVMDMGIIAIGIKGLCDVHFYMYDGLSKHYFDDAFLVAKMPVSRYRIVHGRIEARLFVMDALNTVLVMGSSTDGGSGTGALFREGGDIRLFVDRATRRLSGEMGDEVSKIGVWEHFSFENDDNGSLVYDGRTGLSVAV